MKPLKASLSLAGLVLALGSLAGNLAAHRDLQHVKQEYREAVEESLENRDGFYQLCQRVGWSAARCEKETR